MATTKKTTTVKKTATAAAKKAVKTVAAKVANAAVTTAVTKAKATTKKVAGRVNIADKNAVEHDILKGDPTEASSKIQYGDIERMIFMA